MTDIHQLRGILSRIDGRGYKAYKDIQGNYQFNDFTLFIDHVQGDPFADPSKIRVRVPQSLADLGAFLYQNTVRRLALEDFLARQVRQAIKMVPAQRRGTGKSGLLFIDAGGQEVLERTAVLVRPDWVEARLQIGLPATGRTVLGKQAAHMLCQELPRIVHASLLWKNLPQKVCQAFVECIENQEHIRACLDELGLVAFIADDATLPRLSGVSDRPLPQDRAITLRSPTSLQVSIRLPNPINDTADAQQTITGMGIPKGVALIVGGGYHGKSTLLKALERGVYPHIPGDGREYVVTLRDAVKIRAEDGRRVQNVDITPFITNLPQGMSTRAFSTDDASGSTSQAANILEAMEVGAKLLLLDEDTSATNFMVRDVRMQALVSKPDEPITPFLDRVRELYQQLGVSTILVMGGSGDYLDSADAVIMMRAFVPRDVTQEARAVTQRFATRRALETTTPMSSCVQRIPLAESFNPARGKHEVKIAAKALDQILFGTELIDLRAVEQLVDISQTRAIGHALYLASQRFMDANATLQEVVNEIDQFLNEHGLDALNPFNAHGQHPGNFARPRKYEIAAAINRLRTVRMRQKITL